MFAKHLQLLQIHASLGKERFNIIEQEKILGVYAFAIGKSIDILNTKKCNNTVIIFDCLLFSYITTRTDHLYATFF